MRVHLIVPSISEYGSLIYDVKDRSKKLAIELDIPDDDYVWMVSAPDLGPMLPHSRSKDAPFIALFCDDGERLKKAAAVLKEFADVECYQTFYFEPHTSE